MKQIVLSVVLSMSLAAMKKREEHITDPIQKTLLHTYGDVHSKSSLKRVRRASIDWSEEGTCAVITASSPREKDDNLECTLYYLEDGKKESVGIVHHYHQAGYDKRTITIATLPSFEEKMIEVYHHFSESKYWEHVKDISLFNQHGTGITNSHILPNEKKTSAILLHNKAGAFKTLMKARASLCVWSPDGTIVGVVYHDFDASHDDNGHGFLWRINNKDLSANPVKKLNKALHDKKTLFLSSDSTNTFLAALIACKKTGQKSVDILSIDKVEKLYSIKDRSATRICWHPFAPLLAISREKTTLEDGPESNIAAYYMDLESVLTTRK